MQVEGDVSFLTERGWWIDRKMIPRKEGLPGKEVEVEEEAFPANRQETTTLIVFCCHLLKETGGKNQVLIDLSPLLALLRFVGTLGFSSLDRGLYW